MYCKEISTHGALRVKCQPLSLPALSTERWVTAKTAVSVGIISTHIECKEASKQGAHFP